MNTMNTPGLLSLAPHLHPLYAHAFDHAEEVFAQYDLSTDQRVAHFLAQILHETQGLALVIENLSYSAERLVVVWPKRFPTVAAAKPYARNPVALGNKVYGGRMGNVDPDDGWKFRGRGLLQTTGRWNYAYVSDVLGVDFVADPDLTCSPDYSLPVACALWQHLGANAAADTGDIVLVTKRINGGLHGLRSRTEWLTRAQAVSVSAWEAVRA